MKEIFGNDLKSLINLLRYGNSLNQCQQRRKFLSIEIISKFLKISTYKISKILQKENKNMKTAALKIQRRTQKLLNEQMDFLTSQQTLEKWAGMSLKERCVLFHRKFPEVQISSSYLYRLYKKKNIKFKVIRQQKLTSKMNPQKLYQLTYEMKQKVFDAINNEQKIIFLDEAIFSPQTTLERTWSNQRQSIRQLDMRYKIKTQALLLAISTDYGIEHYMIKARSFNQHDFIAFLDELKGIYNNRKVFIFMDNLRVHKTKLVLSKIREINMEPIFNVPYSPQYNGIECYFSVLKHQYKKFLLQKILKEEQLNVKSLIVKSINSIENNVVQNCAMSGINEMRKFN